MTLYMKKIYLLILIIILISFVSIGLYMYRNPLFLTYKKSGGIAGITETIQVKSDGSYDITHRNGTIEQGKMTEGVFNAIKEMANNLSSVTITPKQNVADFFSYELNIEIGGKSIKATWVDEFAASSEIPIELKDFENTLLNATRLQA